MTHLKRRIFLGLQHDLPIHNMKYIRFLFPLLINNHLEINKIDGMNVMNLFNL